MSAELNSFLKTCSPVSQQAEDLLTEFLAKHTDQDGKLVRPLVCITSGGTTVPLEKRCVRYIDNFTTGTRGALSAEEFLSHNYAVIFLTRDSAFKPFTLGLDTQNPAETLWKFNRVEDGKVVVCPDQETQLQKLLNQLETVYSAGLLHMVNFTSIFDYMKKLEWLSKATGKFGNQVLFYLAAAVSDFYLPWDQMLEHKIQSNEGKLQLVLPGVPKALGTLRHQWAPNSYTISFKLETQEEILISKAKQAMANYGVHAVIANLLHNRKDRVLVLQGLKENGECEILKIDRQVKAPYIEQQLVQVVTQMHKDFISQTSR